VSSVLQKTLQTEMEILKTQNVLKQYSGYTALSDVSISAKEGTIFGLLGPNGAGKTTLIRIINQITAPDSGEVFFRDERLKPSHISQIGYLPEERGLYQKMKVGEQVLYFAQLKGLKRAEALKRIKYWFEKFEIQSWWDKKVNELSKGMQQKVQFVITVLHEPKLLIFDEPFSGFDPLNTNLLKREIIELKNKGCSVIFSTHNMESVEELCDHIVLINKSEKILDGEIDEIRSQFKTNTFEVVFDGNFNLHAATLSADYEIVDSSTEKGKNFLKVKLKNHFSPNDLISSMLTHGQIKSFREILPRMNEIFIRVVEEKNRGN
jgi:ABC-2 type transport system ATP-binding protein